MQARQLHCGGRQLVAPVRYQPTLMSIGWWTACFARSAGCLSAQLPMTHGTPPMPASHGFHQQAKGTSLAQLHLAVPKRAADKSSCSRAGVGSYSSLCGTVPRSHLRQRDAEESGTAGETQSLASARTDRQHSAPEFTSRIYIGSLSEPPAHFWHFLNPRK